MAKQNRFDSMDAEDANSSGESQFSTEKNPADVHHHAKPNTINGYPDVDAKLGRLQCGIPKSTSVKGARITGKSLTGVGLLLLILMSHPKVTNYFGFGMTIVGLLLFLGSKLFRDAGIAVYEHGLSHGEDRFLWSEIDRYAYEVVDKYDDNVVYQEYTDRSTQLSIYADCMSIFLRGTTIEIESLSQIIVNKINEVMVPAALQSLADGNFLASGSLRATAEGLRLKTKWLPFTQMERYEISEGILSIHKRGQSTVPMYD